MTKERITPEDLLQIDRLSHAGVLFANKNVTPGSWQDSSDRMDVAPIVERDRVKVLLRSSKGEFPTVIFDTLGALGLWLLLTTLFFYPPATLLLLILSGGPGTFYYFLYRGRYPDTPWPYLLLAVGVVCVILTASIAAAILIVVILVWLDVPPNAADIGLPWLVFGLMFILMYFLLLPRGAWKLFLNRSQVSQENG